MQTVRDDAGRTYLLLKRSAESSKVRDPKTGTEQYIPNEQLTAVTDESPLEGASRAVPESVRKLLTAVRDERGLGLLVEVAEHGPVGVRQLLSTYDLCESDLHGLLAEFRAAGLVQEATVAGERGYEATDDALDALAIISIG